MVEVFKTNILDPEVAEGIAEQLSKLIPLSKISFDLEDCDKILRIEGQEFCADDVMQIVKSFEFSCEVLPD